MYTGTAAKINFRIRVKCDLYYYNSTCASSGKSSKEIISKSGSDKTKQKNSVCHNSIKSSKLNCLSDATVEELKIELESVNVQYESAKEKSQNSDCANSEMKFLKKRQVQILHLLDQIHEGVNSSDNDCSVDGERMSRKKHRSSSCIETNSICENDISKSHTKEDCGSKLCKSGIKDPAILAKLKKSDSVDGNCISLSLDSFIFRKHLDPRKGFDQHSVSLATVNSLQKCRRISVDNDTCLPNSHGNSESFLCVPSSIATDVSWKKHGSSLSDVNFSENETDSSITLSHFKIKEENLDEEILTKKSHLLNSHSIDIPKTLSLRSFSDGLPCHEIKRERDISPLSLPLPKFAASLRSPKSSPSVLTSPKSTSAHSPRAGHSPSYSSGKSIRIPDLLLHDIPSEKKPKDAVPEEKMNGANMSPMDSMSLFEPQTNDTSESMLSVEPIQSPKCNYDKIKECISSSDSDISPSSSPNRPSIEDRIKALDEKFNAWSGSTRTVSATVSDSTPNTVPDLTPKCTIKRSRFSYLAETRKEPSEIVKTLLAHSTIFDQDSKRLQHIDEKYEPLNVKMDLSPKLKPTFRTKAAAKEFSMPIAPTIQSYNPSVLVKSPTTVMVAQGIISPPVTPQSATSSILSPVTPPVSYTQLPPSVFTPCSPRSTSFSLPSTLLKNADSLTTSLEKDINDKILKSLQVFNTVKSKVDPDFHASSAALATSLKSSPLTCPSETPTHGSIVTSLPLKKEPASPTEAVTENVCKVEVNCKVSIKKEIVNSTSIPLKKDSTILSVTKDHSHFNSVDHDKKEFCDPKDPRLSFSDEVGHWRENGCKEDINARSDSSAKSYPSSDATEKASVPAGKKRVSSIDSNESDSSKSVNPGDASTKMSHESSRDCRESSWSKHDKLSEPEPKKPKLSKGARERSLSPPLHQLSKKSDKKEKSSKTEKCKGNPKPVSVNNPDKVRHEMKCNNKSEYKDKSKSEHRSSKEEKRSKSRESKDCSSKSESRSKPRERRNSEKDNKSLNSNKPSNKPKKESSSKIEKSSEKSCEKPSEKKSEKKSSSRSKSNEFDFSAFMIDDEPVYFSMYDKVKARSSKSQTMKHQTPNDLESVRQKFSKLKQSRAKREDKSKPFDQDTDKDSDSSHHSSESESESKPPKVKQQRKRKLVIESSSDDDMQSREGNSHTIKTEKHFQSDSATDSDFDYNVSHRQSINKSRRKKTELLDSDSSDSDSNFPPKSQTGRKKSAGNRSKNRMEKSKKIIKSEDDMSDSDKPKSQKSKEKEKSKKVKKEKDPKSEHESMEHDMPKKNEDIKNNKKKSKEAKSESDLSPVQKKFKSDHIAKDKSAPAKDKKVESCSEKIQSSEETERHKPYSKKRKKSKKMSRNKDKRNNDKCSQDMCRKQLDESDTKSSLPVLLSPKPSSPLADKQLSPPRLQAGGMSDNEYKSDFSDFEYQQNEDMDASREMWKHLDTKSDTNSEKSSKNKKETSSKSETVLQSPEQDSSLPSFFDKLSDITDSETGREMTDFACDIPPETPKHLTFPSKKDKDFFNTSPHKSKHEKHEDQSSSKQDSVKYCETYSSPSKEERRRKKFKKQSKERRKKSKEETHAIKDSDMDCALSPKPMSFDTIGGDEDSRLSDIRLDEDIAEEARRLEQELLAASEETSTFGDDGPAKREEKLLERRFEEEAAKETRRLEAELLSTGRDSWQKEYDSEPNSGDLCDDKLGSEIDAITGKEDNIFAGLELHSSVGESSQHETDVFLSGHSESDPYKIDDKDVSNEIEDQRKIEDDLAVSALLQEMHCGEIPAPELTKEADYLDMEAHPDETMNYLLPDDGENSLHIADSSPDVQANDSQDAKLESDILSPSSNSEPPPALEISTVEDSIMLKLDNEHQTSENLKNESSVSQMQSKASCYDFHEENSLEMCESKPPVIDLPVIHDNTEQIDAPVSPKPELSSHHKKKQNDKPFRIPSKLDAVNNDDTDDECNSDIAENQLAHFEDITNDTADSKDDDNPPILLPVESPPNLLPVSNSKEHMEPLDKVTMDDNQCLDRIIGKAPSTGDNIFDKVTDLDKQIGDIINSITELKKQSFENDGFRIPGSHNTSNLPEHNITDPLGLNSNANIFDHPKAEGRVESQDFDPAEILKPCNNQVSNSNQTNISMNFTSQSNDSKFEIPQTSSSRVVGPSILNYSEILNSNCETSVIQTAQKMDNNAVTISIPEKSSISNIHQFEENRNMNVSNVNNVSSDNFLLELFGPKNDENFKIETTLPCVKDKTESEINSQLQPKSKEPETTDLSTLSFGIQHEIKPLFEIPEVNEQNEATEFNQEIFERPSDQAKESQIPRLLSFSSEHLFSESSSKKAEDVDDNDSKNIDSKILEEEKPYESPSKSETDQPPIYPSVESESIKEDVEAMDDADRGEEFKENLNIEESLENKMRPADAESVCSDTTDITIPEAKAETENNQLTSSEEQAQEEVNPIEEMEINVKPKTERPRRGRRPKTRKYLESAAQKQETAPVTQNPPVNMRITRRGGGRLATERTRRSLRSDTSDMHNETNDIKPAAVEEIVLSEPEDSRHDKVAEISAVDTIVETENSNSHVEAETKITEKHAKLEEPSSSSRKRRGRRKKNSGDHSNQPSDKSDEHELSKSFTRPKESRLWGKESFSEREHKSTKENTGDIYEFTEDEVEDVKFESVKERLHENIRASSSTIDFKHDIKVPEKKDPIPEKKEKVTEEPKTKPTVIEERETVSKEHPTEHRKISITIRFQKDGHDGTSETAEVIKTSEALYIEETKPESSKQERNTSTKHDTSDVPHSGGPSKSTRKSTRLMNQAASKSTYDEVIDDVIKGNFKASNSSSATSHPEPIPTRVTRRSRSSRRSEESLPLPSESSEDAPEDKNKNEPVFFIPDNTVKEVLPEPKKNVSNDAPESIPASDTSTASEIDKNNDRIASLRSFRMTRSIASKLESSKDASHAASTSSSDHESHKKETTAEEKFDALQKEHKESKEAAKETKSLQDSTGIHPSFPVLMVELPRVTLPASAEMYSKSEKITEPEEDSNSRSSPAVLLDPATGVLTPVSKSSESSSETSSATSAEIKSSNNPNAVTSSISSKNTKISSNESPNITTVIQESPKISQPDESPVAVRAPLVQSLRSRQITSLTPPAVTVQSSSTVPSSCDTSSKLSANEKLIEHVKKPAKKACSAVPVLTLTNTASSTAPIRSSGSEPVLPVTSSISVPVTQSQPPVITSLGVPATVAVTQSSSLKEAKKEDVPTPVVSKISHPVHGYQPPPVRAIVTAVVTQMTAGHSPSLPSNVQTKCSNTVSSSSVLIAPELPVVYSCANTPPTTVSEHIKSISKPVSLPTPMTTDPSNIPHAKEQRMYSSSPVTPVTCTWSSSKVSSSRIADVHPHPHPHPHAHVNTIQTTSISNPVFTTKSESRSSKMSHVTKSTPAFPQQSAFTLSSYDASVLSSAHNIAAVANTSGGMIAELLQNPHLLQQQHKEYFVAAVASGQLQDRMQSQIVRPTTPVASGIPPEIAARLGNPTPPHTPTPPVTASNHSLSSSELHPAHVNSPLHMRHPSQPPLIVPPHPSLGLHHSEINAYVHHLYTGATLNPYAGAIHSDMRAQQEAQARAAVIGMNRFAYPHIPPTVPPNNFRQPSDSRHLPSVMDVKSEQKTMNDLSKIVHESRSVEEKLHSVKPGRSRKENRDLKIMHSDRDDHDSRHIPGHEKIPHSLRQQQHAALYSSIRQSSPHLNVSPQERHADSPIIANLYAAVQGRVPQVDDHKSDSLALSSHHYKNDATDSIKPPIAHQTQPSTIPYHSLDPASRQQMLGVMPIGSPAPGHIDGRSSNPAHSPSSHIYKKDSSHSQPIPSFHNPASDKRVSSEHSNKVLHSRTLVHQGPSISPAPAGMPPANSPLPFHMPHNPHSSLPPSPHVILPTNEQSRSRVNSHMTTQLGPDISMYAPPPPPPPPAHGMSQSSNIPRTLSQTPQNEGTILERYPVLWQGLLALKNDQAAVQMHFVSGNMNVALASLPPLIDGEAAPVRISQRMRLDNTQLDGVYRKLQLKDEHCILLALPCGKDHNDLLQQSNNLKLGFINYLSSKHAAGIVNAAAPGTQQPAFVIHIFPDCEFTDSNLAHIAPSLLQIVNEISHLVIIIASV